MEALHLGQGGTFVMASKGVRQMNVFSRKRASGLRRSVTVSLRVVSTTTFPGETLTGKTKTCMFSRSAPPCADMNERIAPRTARALGRHARRRPPLAAVRDLQHARLAPPRLGRIDAPPARAGVAGRDAPRA